MELTETELAYIAGFIDGDGSITIIERHRTNSHKERPIHFIMVSASQKRPEILIWIKSKVGGSVQEWHQNGGKQFRCHIYYQKAIDLCNKLSPYLIEKKEHSKLVAQFPVGSMGRKLDDSIVLVREILYYEMRELQLRHNVFCP